MKNRVETKTRIKCLKLRILNVTFKLSVLSFKLAGL
jgi:hypothetical protein